MKVFQMNDCDWYVGESLESCKRDYIQHYGDELSELDQAYELSSEELDTLVFRDDINTDYNSRTFRNQLEIEIKRGGAFPRIFATTEF